MNFYETKMGNIFFNSQLPKLISALQDIASALSRPAPATNPDGTAIQKHATATNPDSMALPKPAPATNAGNTPLLNPATVTNSGGTAFLNPVPAINMDGMADPDFLHDLLYWMYEMEVFGNREQLATFDADVTQAENPSCPPWASPRSCSSSTRPPYPGGMTQR